jgi:hypothetical protein
MNPNNKLDRKRLTKANENSTILPDLAAVQGRWWGTRRPRRLTPEPFKLFAGRYIKGEFPAKGVF